MKKLIGILTIVIYSTALAMAFEKSYNHTTSQNEIKSTIEYSITYDEARKIILSHYPDCLLQNISTGNCRE